MVQRVVQKPGTAGIAEWVVVVVVVVGGVARASDHSNQSSTLAPDCYRQPRPSSRSRLQAECCTSRYLHYPTSTSNSTAVALSITVRFIPLDARSQ